MFLRKIRIAALGLGLVASVALNGSTQTAMGQTVSFEKILEYVRLDVSETKIVQLVQSSGTQLVLGADQVGQLKQAGASESLVSSLQAKAVTPQPNSDVANFILVLDCSGSMNDKLADGSSKWHAARQAAIDFVRAVPNGRSLALIAYGLDAGRQCSSVDLLRPLHQLDEQDKQKLCSMIESLNAVGHTPITRSLNLAGQQLSAITSMSSIVLITDGMENCKADPIGEAGHLVKQYSHLSLKINVIGFCMSDNEAAQVSKIASAGNGKFMKASDVGELLNSVKKIDGLAQQEANTDELLPLPLTELEALLVEQLSDADISVREAAARTIKERKMSRIAPALVNMIAKVPYGNGIWGDSDRKCAIDSLMSLAPEKAPRAIERALWSKEYSVRVWAAEAIATHKIVGAVPIAERRLLTMRKDDIEPGRINGTDEADKLFVALQQLSPESLQSSLIKMARGQVDTVRAWATQKLSQVD